MLSCAVLCCIVLCYVLMRFIVLYCTVLCCVLLPDLSIVVCLGHFVSESGRYEGLQHCNEGHSHGGVDDVCGGIYHRVGVCVRGCT